MPDSWEQIRRVSVEVTGVDAKNSGLLNVVVQLSAAPPQEWPHRFENPVGTDGTSTLHQPRVNGSRITLHVEDDRMREYIQDVDARIGAANLYYEGEVLPAKTAKAKALSDERDEITRRVTEAQRIADSL